MTDTESKWLARVAQWQASGLSLREFAAGREFKWTTLRYWRSKLRHKASPKGTEATGPAVRMARVVRSPLNRLDDSSVVIRIGGAEVVVSAGFDRGLLRAVVEALEMGS
jgi:hypothetical protein